MTKPNLTPVSDALNAALAEAQERRFIGPGSLDRGVRHALGFAVGVDVPRRMLDLGSGGGLPALVLAERWPDTEVVLVEGSTVRGEFLQGVVTELGLEGRVSVRDERAEVAGRAEALRAEFDLVTARGFAPPAVTAECAAPFLRQGGALVVSEPPDRGNAAGPGAGPAGGRDPERGDGYEGRWDPVALQELGLVLAGRWDGPYHYRLLRQESLCSSRYPRRVGVPAKRPLF